MLISVVKPNFILVNQLLPMGCFSPTELISAFSSCPKLAQVSHGCGISQPLKFNRTQSLFYTPKCLRQGGWGVGKKRYLMKKQWQWSLLQVNRCGVWGGWRETVIPMKTQHFTLAIRQKHHQIAFVTGRRRKLKIHMAVGFDQLTLAVSTHCINRLISSKYLEMIWLLTKSFPAEFLMKGIPWHFAYIISITTNIDHIQISWNKHSFFQEKGIWHFPQKKQSQQRLTASIKTCLNVISTLSCKRYKQVAFYSCRYNPLKISTD